MWYSELIQKHSQAHTEVDDMLKSKFLGCLGIVFAMVGIASAQPISYQGHLLDGGVPAEGLYDLECRVFDAPIDGVQLGQTVGIDDLLVSGGLFSVELDFEYEFDAASMFFEISLRPGVSVDLHEVLMPRQQILPAPTAISSTFSVLADSITGPSFSDGGISAHEGRLLVFGDGDDRVVINRADALTADEYFGVHVTSALAGGITVSNEDAFGVPSVSYAVGGVVGASHSFAVVTKVVKKEEVETRTWSLDVGGSVALEADSTGISSPKITSPQYMFSSPKTQAVTVAGDVFHSALGAPFAASFFGGGAYLTTPGSIGHLVAPVVLPHGATITKLVGRFEDNDGADLSITLNGAQATESIVTIATLDTKGVLPAVGIQSLVSTEITKGSEVVDSFSTGYYIRVFSSSWPGDSSMRVWSVTIEYTVIGPT